MKAYKGRADVEYVEPNMIVHAQLTPNDPEFSSLWGFNNSGQLIIRPDGSSFSGTPGADIHLPAAWDLKTGSGSVIIADIDTGVDYNHPDLAGNIWTHPGEIAGNGIDDDGNGFVDDLHGWNFVNNTNDPMDDHGHGTHTAGTIGAVGNNGAGGVGVNWIAKVMPIKFMNSAGSGTIEDAARAILYASQMGAKISNNSWGCTGIGCFSQTFEDALKVAYGRGMLFVVAAGNTSAFGVANNNDATPTYPCNSTQPNVLCVAATENHDAKAFFSNYGNVSVDLGAPGQDILSTIPTGNCLLCDPSGYMFLSGTSMAAPHVSGAAALALAQYPTLTTGQLKNLLIGSTDPIPALKGLTATGGRLNVNNALRSNFIIDSPDSAAASAGQTTDFTISVQSLNGFGRPVTLSFAASEADITGSFSVNSVTPPANGSAGTTLTVSTASGIAAGSYLLTISGSATDGSGQAEAHLGTMTLSVQTDLALTALSGPTLGEAGKWFTITDTVQNLDTALAKGFYIGYYLSTDSAITPSDIRIGSRWIPALSPGASSAGADVWIPASLPSGTYYLGAIIDDLSRVPDSNAANNTLPGRQISVNSGAPASPIWTDRHNAPNNGDDNAVKVVVDAAANSYVTGSTCRIVHTSENSCSSWDITTIKYDPDGNRLWVATYNNDASDYAATLAVDASGNTYVGGLSCSTLDMSGLCSVSDYLILKYDPHGNLLWAARYGNGSGSSLSDLNLDASGNIYVTGTSCDLNCTSWSDATVKFDADGNRLWVARNSFGNFSHGIVLALDAAGNTYVTGDGSPAGFTSYMTAKYDQKGSLIWTAQYNNDGRYTSARAIALDTLGNVYVSGVSHNGTDFDIATVKYDSTGQRLWANRYDNGSEDSLGFWNGIYGQTAVDDSGNVYITGVSSNGLDNDYITIKYDTNGNSLWSARYNNGAMDVAQAQAIDHSGNVYVTGLSLNCDQVTLCSGWARPGSSDDYLSIKYDLNGHPIWVGRYENGTTDFAFALAIDESENVYVTGASSGCRVPFDSSGGCRVSDHTGFDYATLKYTTRLSDLVMTKVSGPSAGVVGQSILLSDTVKNQGTEPAGSFSVGYYLSGDATITTADLFLGSRSVNGLTAGASHSATASITVPSNLSPGIYYLGAIANYDNRISETNDANNDLAGNRITITTSRNLLFSDDFNRTTGLGPNWQVYFGSFITDGNSAISQGNIANWAAVTPNLNTNDYSVEATLAVPPGSLYSGIAVRGNPANSFYKDLYAAQIATDGHVNLYRRNAGNWTLLKSAPASIAAGTAYTLKLTVSGVSPVNLQVSLNGAVLFNFSDASASRILSGIPGIGNYNPGVSYDRFTVSSISSSAPPSLQSISVTPTNPTIASGSALPFTATGHFGDGSTNDLTSSVSWSSSTPAVATISNQAGSQGIAKGVSAGSSTISAVDPATNISGGTILTVTAGNQAPIARPSANPTSGVAPLLVHFDGSGSSDPDGTISSYVWSFGDGAGGTGATADHTYTAAGTYTATLTVTDHHGAKGSAQTTVTVSTPSSSILFNDDFNRTSGLGPDWQVLFGSFTTDGGSAVSQGGATNWAAVTQALNTNDYTVESVLTIPSGSLYSGIIARGDLSTGFYQDLYAAQIATNGSVNLYRRNAGSWTRLKSTQAGIVAGTAYTLKLKVAGSNPVTLEVSLNGNSLFTYQDSSASRILSGAPGIQNYNPNVKYDRFAIFSNTAAVNQPPVAKIFTDVTSGLAPLAVHFDGSTSFDPDGSIASYLWNFGDGSAGTTSIMSHTYHQAGTYTASLTVTDNDGATGAAQVMITVTAPGTSTLFNDDFNRAGGLGSNWQVYFGSFTTDGNNAVSQDTVANWAAIAPSLNTSDYSVEAALTIPAGSLYSGIVARGNPATGFLKDLYAAQIATNGTVNLYRRNAGTWTQLKSTSAGVAAGTYYTLKLKVSGTNPVNLEVSLNGSVLFTFSDVSASRILSGLPGIQNYNSGVKYDRFTVTSP